MIARITGRGALTMTTALVACGVLVLSPAGQSLWRDGWQPGTVEPQEGPEVTPVTEAPPADPVAETVAPGTETDQARIEAPDMTAVVETIEESPAPETAAQAQPDTTVVLEAVEDALADTDGRAEVVADALEAVQGDVTLPSPQAPEAEAADAAASLAAS